MSSDRPFTGRHMLFIMTAFFGVIFIANFTMVYFSISSWTGLVVKNSYVASQQFNETTAKLEKAAKGVNAILAFENQTLKIRLTDANNMAVIASNVIVTLGRPSHERDDQIIKLMGQGGGIYVAEYSLAKGQWAGRVTADIAGHEGWQRPLRLIVKE